MSPSAAKVHSIGSILTVVSCVFFVISFICTLTGLPGENGAPPSAMFTANGYAGRCNPFTRPGFVAHMPYPLWKTFEPACPPSTVLPDMLATLPRSTGALRSPSVTPQRQAALMHALRNRTVVLVGDGVDRTMIMNLCEMVGEKPVPVDASHPWGASLKQLTYVGKNMGDSLLADYCYVPKYSAIFTSFYHYGADTNELWREQRDFFPPGQFEKRVTELLKPYLDAMASRSPYNVQMPRALSNKPDLVVFSSNLWDLAAWAMEDVSTYRTDPSTDLSEKRLNWWRSRNVDMIETLRKELGTTVPLAWRSAHVPLTKVNDTVQWFFQSMHVKGTLAPVQDGIQFAFPNRIAELNSARRAIVQLTGSASVRGAQTTNTWSAGYMPYIRDIPFGEITFGQETKQDTLLNPGLESHAYLFWSMVLHELVGPNAS